MCTVTIVPVGEPAWRIDRSPAGREEPPAGSPCRVRCVRLACNRDELRTRPAALPPVIRFVGARRVIMPIDPISGGTWIAVNDAGIAAALLNVNPGRGESGAPQAPTLSRGALIPRIMGCWSLVEAERMLAATDPRRYPPFRLVLIDDRELAHFYSGGAALRHEHEPLAEHPHLFTSSGLGDALVEPPRRELFERVFTPDGDWESQQDAFHRHSWADRRHLSVCMERDEARTVSHTVVEIEPERVVLTYVPDAPDRAQPLAPIALARVGTSP
jgi:hypothetical protein